VATEKGRVCRHRRARRRAGRPDRGPAHARARPGPDEASRTSARRRTVSGLGFGASDGEESAGGDRAPLAAGKRAGVPLGPLVRIRRAGPVSTRRTGVQGGARADRSRARGLDGATVSRGRAALSVVLVTMLTVAGCTTPGQRMDQRWHSAPSDADTRPFEREPEGVEPDYTLVRITPAALTQLASAPLDGPATNPELAEELRRYEYRIGAQDVLTFTVWD